MNHHDFFRDLFSQHLLTNHDHRRPKDTTCDAWEARIKDASRISEAALQAGLDLVKPGANEGFSACEEL